MKRGEVGGKKAIIVYLRRSCDDLRKQHSMIRLTITFLLVLIWQNPAYGYIDPGSGSAIMSAIIGFFVAAGMLIKTYWYKLKSFFTGGAGKGQQDTANTDVGDERDSSR